MLNAPLRLLALLKLPATNNYLCAKTLSATLIFPRLRHAGLYVQHSLLSTRTGIKHVPSVTFVRTFDMASEHAQVCATEQPENGLETFPIKHMSPTRNGKEDNVDDAVKYAQISECSVEKTSIGELDRRSGGENTNKIQSTGSDEKKECAVDDTGSKPPHDSSGHVDDIGTKPQQTPSEIAPAADDGSCSLNRKGRKRKSPRLHMTFKKPRLASNETMSQTKYYFENGLRKVYPYDHKFNTFCKGRWIGKSLREIYSSEFRLYPIEHYEKAMKDGRLMVNLERPTSMDQIVQNNDLISSTVHRHECPVTDARIEVIEDNDDFFVINKPASIPLHPAGRFRHNTVLSILAKVEKEYVCRVVGDFSKFTLDASNEHRITVGEGERPDIIVDEPLKVYDYKVGTSIVSHDDDAKDCQTVFRCKSTDGKTSVVSCKPKTGRTHQIRVHLQYLGYPIVNDQVYNSPAWGKERFKLGPITKPLKAVMEELVMMKKWLADMENAENLMAGGEAADTPLVDEEDEVVRREGDIVIYRSSCAECRKPLPDPTPSELVMYLHALKYKGPDWEFETPLPEWAQPGWVEKEEHGNT